MGSGSKNYKELQALLDGQVAKFGIPLPVQSKIQVLPLGEITWENFERLCARMITKDGAIFDCSRYGKPGEEQQGIDILARRWIDGKLEIWCYQCKRHKTFGVADLREAISTFKFKAEFYVLFLSSIAPADVRKEIFAYPNIQLWDQEDISRKLKDFPIIVADFFSKPWKDAFCGITVQLPAESNQEAIRQAIGIDLGHKEWLHSNLLLFKKLPEKIYRAPTPLSPSSAISESQIALIPPYKVSKKQDYIYTFCNIKDPETAKLVGNDPQNTTFEPVEHFLTWRGGFNIFRDLFYEHLRRKCFLLGMAYDGEHHRFYFTPLDGAPREYRYQAYKRASKRQLAYPYLDKETKELRFWVHQAARLSLFEADRYYLRIEPGFAFTKDGYEFLASEDIGPLSTRRQSGERNQNVFNHLIFWRSILMDQATELIRIDCGSQEFAISTIYESAKANFGIPYDSQPIEEVAMEEDEFDLEMILEGEGEDVHDNE